MAQLDMVDLFGRFGLLAQRVAHRDFRAHMLDESLMGGTSLRVPGELLVRLTAFAAVAGVSRNRLMCELLQEATDELEHCLQQEDVEALDRYTHIYENLCEQSMDARD